MRDPILTPSILSALLTVDEACLWYTVTLHPADIQTFLRAVPNANRFNGTSAAQMVGHIEQALTEYRVGPTVNFQVGREYSRVLYVRIGKPFTTPVDWASLTQVLDNHAYLTGADEHDVDTNTESDFVYRIWWD